jgi:hypothetical protein
MKTIALTGAAFAAVFAAVHPCAAQQRIEAPASVPRDTGRFAAFVREASEPLRWAEPAATAVYDQTRDKPTGWNEDSDGMAQRMASQLGKAAISLTVRHSVAALLGQPAAPVRCATATGGARIVAAALESIADRGCDGSIHPSVPRMAGRVASGFAPLLWHQPDYTASKAAVGLASGVASSALLKVALAVVRPH